MMLKKLVGSAVCGLAGLGLVVCIRPAWGEKIIGSFNNQTGDCECTCTPGPCPPPSVGEEVRQTTRLIAICKAACARASGDCSRPLTEHCRVAKDPRWPQAILKCRSVFSLPR